MCCKKTGLKNLGQPGCTPYGSIPTKLGFALKRDSLGMPVVIDLSAPPFDEDFFNDLKNDPDRAKRWHFTPTIRNFDWVEGDEATLSDNGGNTVRTGRPGVTVVTFEIWGISPQFAGEMRSLQCKDIQFVDIDIDANLNGYGKVGGTQMGGIPISKDSFRVKYSKSKDGGLSMVAVTFEVDPSFNVSKMVTLEADEIEYEDLVMIEDNITVEGTIGTITTTSVVVDLDLIYGTAIEADPFTGAVVGELVVFNKTDNTTVTVLTAPESALDPGEYTPTFAAQTSGDVLTIGINKLGFDMIPVEFVIP